eukprot:TRINITY_DN2836_c0_g1_i1.p1 TRINITY_DN2836_c0_g1~~TRINITY_DN2836_c0_g1_i1.p1  ORF type:complete len:235 (-),score=30.83 TRINITY_DN2836_c0_g1_i1:173-877(-)
MMALVCWNCVLSTQVLLLLFKAPREYDSDGAEEDEESTSSSSSSTQTKLLIHIFVWGIACLSAIIPGIKNHYGPSTNGCWINDDFTVTRIISMVGPLTLIYFYMLVVLIIVLKNRNLFSMRVMYREFGEIMSSGGGGGSSQSEYQFANNNLPLHFLVLYTLSFLLFWTPPLILRYVELFHVTPLPIVYLDIVCVGSQGIGNGVVWASSSYISSIVKGPAKRFSSLASAKNILGN